MTAPKGALENPDVSFEKEDIRATPVLKFLVGLAVTCVVVAFLLLWFHGAMRSYVAGLQPTPPHMTFDAKRAPVGPPLQEHPNPDLRVLQAEEVLTLSSYGWVDKDRGVVRIPVEEAMRIVAARGLGPAEAPGTAAPSGTTAAAKEDAR
jgi:hypothetical protein